MVFELTQAESQLRERIMKEHNVQGARLLLVDDHPQNLRILANLLKSEYRIMTALDGDKALQLIHGDHPPDLVLLDINMPGMDGYQVCQKIKANPNTSHIPVIFLTASSQIEDETHGLEVGAVDYITKPFHIPVVRARIRTHLELKRAWQEAREKSRALARELEDMYDLQRSVMPESAYQASNLLVQGMYHPSGLTGGDYFDYLSLPGGGLRCLVADVSGHGARAAFLMAMVRTVFHFDEHKALPLSLLVQRLNRQLIQTMGNSGDFVTLMGADVHPENNCMEYVNAGHCPGFFQDESDFKELEATTTLLGLLETDVQTRILECKGNWNLLLYTDGFYECSIQGEGILGYEPFRDLCAGLMQRDGLDLHSLPRMVAESAPGIVGFQDDLTALHVRKISNPNPG